MKKRGIVITPDDFNGVDWLAKMRELGLNTLGLHSGGGANHDLFQRMGKFGEEPFRKQVRQAGIEYEYETHAAAALMDPALFTSHPEYFSFDLEKQERVSTRNWCISNPDVPAIIADNAEEIARRLPSSTHHYYYWAADASGANCQCPECRKYSVSDLYLRSVNAMSEGILRADPLAQVCFLSYADIVEPPRCTEPMDNVFLEFAPYVRSYEKSIADRTSEVNAPYRKAFENMIAFFGKKNCCVLEYYLDSSWFSHYKKPAVRPVFTEEVLRRDLEYYCSFGVTALTSFAVYMDGDYFSRFDDTELQIYSRVLKEFLPDD